MKAAIVYAKGDLRLDTVPIPDPPPDSIRVRVKACAICGTDLRIYKRGDHRAEYPVIVGHEIAGEVDAISPGAQRYGFAIGARVCVAPGHGCGRCRMCRCGQPNVCIDPYPSLGYKVDGGFAEQIAVPENILRLGFVNRIPDELSFRQASIAEIVACCINGQHNSPVHRDDVVVVLGAGPAGVIHTQLARLAGARRTIIAQRSRARLDLAAERFEIDRVVCMSEEDLGEVVLEETNGSGADVVFVCAPSPAAQRTALELAGPRGRVNFFGGLPPDGRMVTLDANALHYKEIFIAGASSSVPQDNRDALSLLASRQIDPDRLITHTLPLEDVVEAFEIAESRTGIKVVVEEDA